MLLADCTDSGALRGYARVDNESAITPDSTAGEMLGADQPLILQLLEIADEKAQKALKGVMMELEDCAFPLLASMQAHSDPSGAFRDADYALLVGARPRGPGMERRDLLAAVHRVIGPAG